jgi:cobalamin biosynthetic protein CobC
MAPPAKPLPGHGGDLAFATHLYGAPADGWLDLSTGINPFGYPLPALPEATYRRLPDRAALEALLLIARQAYGVPDSLGIVAVPGSESAIRLLPSLVRADRAAIVSPTYGSHVAAWPGATEAASIDDVPDGAVAVVVNPNNPDGRIVAPTDLVRLAKRVSWLIVDEAFADVAPGASIVPALARGNTLVLRSLGKFYGLAGVRLGFVIGPPIMLASMSAALGDWPVSGPAIAIGAAALADTAWRDSMRAHLHSETNTMRALFSAHGLTVVGGTDLFTLVATEDVRALHERLASRGIWTRAFSANPAWLRFGVTAAAGRERLARALSDLR